MPEVLEPLLREGYYNDNDRMITSIAQSLKRIADALQGDEGNEGIRQILFYGLGQNNG